MRKHVLCLVLIALASVSGCGTVGLTGGSDSSSYSCNPPRSVRKTARSDLAAAGLSAPPDTGVFTSFTRAFRNREELRVHLYLRSGIMQHRETGGSLLHHAARNGDLTLMEKALACGLDPDEKNNQSLTPLHVAVRNSHPEVLELLLSAGGSPNVVNEAGQSPLHVAVVQGESVAIDQLLAAGANPNLRDQQGRTPFYLAVVRGRRQLAEKLKRNGGEADVELASRRHPPKLRGGTLLHLAVYRELPRAVKWFVEFGAELEGRAVNNWTPLHLAAWRGNSRIIDYLARGGANVNVVGGTPLDDYIFESRTPLHIAAYEGKVKAVRALLKAGADPTILTREGWKASHLASYFDHEKVVRMLEVAEARR